MKASRGFGVSAPKMQKKSFRRGEKERFWELKIKIKCESLSLSFSLRLFMRNGRTGGEWIWKIGEVAGKEIEKEGERVNEGSTVWGS